MCPSKLLITNGFIDGFVCCNASLDSSSSASWCFVFPKLSPDHPATMYYQRNTPLMRSVFNRVLHRHSHTPRYVLDSSAIVRVPEGPAPRAVNGELAALLEGLNLNPKVRHRDPVCHRTRACWIPIFLLSGGGLTL